MRELKFRVWDDTPTKDSYQGVMINHDYAIKSTYLIDAINGAYPIMQYTGRKDENGTEVYEGDIVKVKGAKRIGEYVTEIIYKGNGFALKDNKTYFNDYCILPSMIKVIGNIYQNPELLK